MMGNARRVGIALVMAFALPALAQAQTASWHAVQTADLNTMKDKFVGLAEAMSATQYEWRPMEGVRSVKEVLALIIAECHLFPTGWGVAPPAHAEAGFGPEMERTAALSRAQILAELGPAFDHMIGIVSDMSASERDADANYFGQDMQVHAYIATAMADMHEHLGQLIAYARTNRVVPPWSM